jgi:hypothetical protein
MSAEGVAVVAAEAGEALPQRGGLDDSFVGELLVRGGDDAEAWGRFSS